MTKWTRWRQKPSRRLMTTSRTKKELPRRYMTALIKKWPKTQPKMSSVTYCQGVPVGKRDGNLLSNWLINIDKTYQKDKNASVQSINGGHPDGEKRTLSQITIPEGWKNQNPDEGNVMHGPDGLIPSLDRTIPKGWKNQNPDEGNVQNEELPEG